MNRKYRSQSRRTTPWDNFEHRTPSQDFIRSEVVSDYCIKHKNLTDTNEADFINQHDSSVCPLCGSNHTKKCGFTKDGIQNHWCFACHHHFTPLTNTIHQGHKIPLADWIEYWRNLIQYLSLTANSWNGKNAFTTAKYWFKKTCLLLTDYQESILLRGRIWYDVTMIPVRESDIITHPDGKKLRGNSTNQINIGVATDLDHTLLFILGKGHPRQKDVYDALRDHIVPGSTLVTDKDRDHRLLVHELDLTSEEYDAKAIKKLPDKDNPMNPVNQVHNLLKKFLRAHSGFIRSDLQDYINLFAFMVNPPEDPLEKIDVLLNLSFTTRKTLKYRDLYHRKKAKN